MKKIKDPIYGYITIEDWLLPIIDSANFQRLRNIIQTSYTSIYPSSLHNRFTHSLGVYNLGKLAFSNLCFNSAELIHKIPKKELEQIEKSFVFACLCHDLGHSPFSHTGEKFYDKQKINDELILLVDNRNYKKDVHAEGGIVGKEHEIMSALLSLQVFKDCVSKKYYEFFARCIIGLQYKFTKNITATHRLKMACVELLNSDIIDVDKLDYLIRDSYMSGYSSITIDYNRLLSGICLNQFGSYPIYYQKSALSVLESVLTANDMERRWVQSHPIVLYESFLLQTIIREINTKYKAELNSKSLLSLEALTLDGINIKEFGKIRLLSDTDIIYLAKQTFDESDAVKEYFNRSIRRHPIWKSEAEFTLLFDFNKNQKFVEIIQRWEEMLLSGEYGVYSINNEFYNKLHKDTERLAELKANSPLAQMILSLKRFKSLIRN